MLELASKQLFDPFLDATGGKLQIDVESTASGRSDSKRGSGK